MIVSRLVKWAAAGVLALGIPAAGLAKTHTASVPGSVSVTPVKAVSSKHVTKKTSSHRKTAAKRQSKNTRAHSKNTRTNSKNTRAHSKNSRTHATKNTKSSKGHTRVASKSHHPTSHKKTRRA